MSINVPRFPPMRARLVAWRETVSDCAIYQDFAGCTTEMPLRWN